MQCILWQWPHIAQYMSVTNIHRSILIEQLVQDNIIIRQSHIVVFVIFERHCMDHHDNCESRLENNP